MTQAKFMGWVPNTSRIFVFDPEKFKVQPPLPLVRDCKLWPLRSEIEAPEVKEFLYDQKDWLLVVSGFVLSTGEEIRVKLPHWGTGWKLWTKNSSNYLL